MAGPSLGCAWDSDTLAEERISSPKLASAILNEPPKPDTARLRDRIAKLESAPRKEDPAWWNDLAGAHIRLGEPQKAVDLLEPLLKRFPKDYGVHANLGTAYHLLGRYADAEREIARDLEINPDAHFGLEKYHLAFLQYLVRDKEYQARHVYVDEWTEAYFTSPGTKMYSRGTRLAATNKDTYLPIVDGPDSKTLTREQAVAKYRKEREAAKDDESRRYHDRYLTWLTAAADRPPPYRYRWDLVKDPKFSEGVVYMASLNRQQPAAWVMLGIAAVDHGDLHLGKAAYQRAINLGSSQADVLHVHLDAIDEHLRRAGPKPEVLLGRLIGAAVGVFILLPLAIWGVVFYFRRRKRRLMREARA